MLTEIDNEAPGSTATDTRLGISQRVNELIRAANAGQLSSFRNKLINGDFGIWQRGTVFPGSALYFPDRWLLTASGASRSSDVPNSLFRYSLQLDQSSATYAVALQRIEAANAAQLSGGVTVRVSFWAKNLGGAAALAAQIYRANAADNFAGVTYVGQPINSSFAGTDWEFFEGALALPATVANGLELRILRQNTSANSTRIAGIQVEIADVTTPKSTPFERRARALEISLCRRYFEKSFDLETAPAQNIGVNTGEFTWPARISGAAVSRSPWIPFQERKRYYATMTYYSPGAASAEAYNVTDLAACTSTSGWAISDAGFQLRTTGNAACDAADRLGLHWTASAEL